MSAQLEGAREIRRPLLNTLDPRITLVDAREPFGRATVYHRADLDAFLAARIA